MKMRINNQEAVSKIEKQIQELNNINFNGNIQEYKKIFNELREVIIMLLKNIFSDNSIALKFESETIILENDFSKQSTKTEINKKIDYSKIFLRRLANDISNNVYLSSSLSDDCISQEIALVIVRRILQNFHKHIETMYQDKVHGRGKILKEDLDKIKIGNEYDVQRILYSIIRPIFPMARIEIPNDTGYNYVRYDIFIDQYDIVIEIKCTRNNMSERDITEELGSDAFHYKSTNLFFFIYDKEKIIKNVDAFTKSYTKTEDVFNKHIETIVIQPISL